MNFEKQYTEWLTMIQPDLKEIFGLLGKRISDEPEKLIFDLEEAEAWNGRAAYLLAQANSFLDKASMYYLPNRDEATRELDRKVLLESKVSDIREVRDRIEGLRDSLKTRITLGQSILRYYSQTIEHKKVASF